MRREVVGPEVDASARPETGRANGIARDQLRSVVNRILRLKDEQDALSTDIREVYAEAKSNGFDKTALGLVVSQLRKRAKDPTGYAEISEVASVYLAAYEMVAESLGIAHASARVEIIEEFSQGSQAKRTEAEPHAVTDQERNGVRSRASGGAGTVASILGPEAERAVRAPEEISPKPTAYKALEAVTVAEEITPAPNLAAVIAALPIEPFPDLPTFLQRGHAECIVKERA